MRRIQLCDHILAKGREETGPKKIAIDEGFTPDYSYSTMSLDEFLNIRICTPGSLKGKRLADALVPSL